MSQKKEEAIQKVMTEFESMANLVLSQLDRLEIFFQSGETNLPEKLREEFDANEKLIDQYEVKLSERIIIPSCFSSRLPQISVS
jgi:phosphate transport system protein